MSRKCQIRVVWRKPCVDPLNTIKPGNCAGVNYHLMVEIALDDVIVPKVKDHVSSLCVVVAIQVEAGGAEVEEEREGDKDRGDDLHLDAVGLDRT
jgi:hypothetical protein